MIPSFGGFGGLENSQKVESLVVESPAFDDIGQMSIRKVTYKCRIDDPSEKTQELVQLIKDLNGEEDPRTAGQHHLPKAGGRAEAVHS